MERLWAPWRLDYVAGGTAGGCIFCAALKGSDGDGLIIHRGSSCFVLLNRYPYASGHVMIAPNRHVAMPGELDAAERAEMWELLDAVIAAMGRAYGPHAYNAGLNLGRAAGAGVEGHLHLHVVPRWTGDTNFMPVLADVRVMPQHLMESWRGLRDAWTG